MAPVYEELRRDASHEPEDVLRRALHALLVNAVDNLLDRNSE
ncbi:hypothetical protein [Streptomyces sanglieri]